MTASKSKTIQPKPTNPPETLENHIFYGMKLDEEQKAFRDAIWSDQYDVVVCESVAGSGKTTTAIATAILLCEYGKYNGIIYQIAGGVYESKQGLLPGTIDEKSRPLFAPLYQAVARLGYDPMRMIYTGENIISLKDGGAMITAQSDSYIRGTSFGEHDDKKIIILDEAQNLITPAMRTTITRVNAGSKLIVLGQQKQCDLKFPGDSGFPRFREVFQKAEQEGWCKFCSLTHNYRGRVSALGDTI